MTLWFVILSVAERFARANRSAESKDPYLALNCQRGFLQILDEARHLCISFERARLQAAP